MQGIIDALEANAVLVSLIVGSLTPLLISVAQQPNLSTVNRKRLATGLSVVVGVLLAASTGQLDGVDWSILTDPTRADMASLVSFGGVIGAVWAASEATFQKLWKPSGVAQGVESVTSPWVKPEVSDSDVELDLDGWPLEGFETK